MRAKEILNNQQGVAKGVQNFNIGYHVTKKQNVPSIMKNGLRGGKTTGFTLGGEWADAIYGKRPVYVALDKGLYKDTETTELKIDLRGLRLVPDLSSLIDLGAMVSDNNSIYWKHDEDIPKLLMNYAEDGEIFYDDLLKNENVIRAAILSTRTAAILDSIPANKISNNQQGLAEDSLNEFAPGGFNGGDDDEFSPVIAKIAEEDGFTKGVVLADGATLELAITINQWHNQHGGMYKQYFAKGFKEGRMEKIRYDNKQYNLNLKLMKDGSIRHGEQGLAEGSLNEFAPAPGGRGDGDGDSEFIPWLVFVKGIAYLLKDNFTLQMTQQPRQVKARFVPIDPMEYGPSQIYAYDDPRYAYDGQKRGVGIQGMMHVGKYSKRHDGKLLTGYYNQELDGNKWIQFTLTNIPKVAVIIAGNKEGALQQNVAEEEVNEFAVDDFGDNGDKRSKFLGTVARLFKAGNKIDWKVPGQMGHVVRVDDNGITMKRWKMPRSKMSFFLPMYDDSKDSKYTIKLIAPNHYAVVSAEQGVTEDWSEKYKKSINCKNPKGFSQRAHCQGRKKNNEEVELDERKRKRKKKTARYYYGPAYYFGATDTGAAGGDGGGLEEDWKKSLANIGLAGAIGLGAAGGLEIKDKIKSAFTKPTTQTTQPVQVQQPSVSPITSSPLETYLMNAAKKAGLTGIELAQFLGQCAHETLDYKRMIERGAKHYFNKYELKFAPKKAKILGNIKPGDGERYKGRGYIQLTGRYNYRMAGKALNLPLEQNPELAAQPEIAAQIALWYWNQRVRPDVENFADTTSVTRKINPGLSGLEDRHENFVSYIGQRGD